MSAGDRSQFSPNWQQPTPTIETLSQMASLRTDPPGSGIAGKGNALPVVVGPPSDVVDAAEARLDRHADRDLLGRAVGELEMDAGTLDLGDGDDRRGIRGG